PSGSGKTIIGLELIAQKLQPALILVHRKQLLDQWVERIQSFLGIPKAHIGRISGIKKVVGKQITVAMMQSLIKMENINELSNIFGTIIVDECHHIPAKTFRELICQFNPYYLYGLTATPKRKYNDEKLIYYYIEDIIATVAPNFRKEEIPVNTQIEIQIKETNLSVPFDYQTDEFEIVSKILIFDSKRNIQITEDILREAKNGHKILVLTERKEHVEVLYQYLKGQTEIITLSGEDSASKRVVKMDQIKAGHFQILIATGQLLGEGMDFGTINCLFLVYPFSFEGKLIQYMGRIKRAKTNQIVYDYHDKQIQFFDKLFKKRMRYYKKVVGVSIIKSIL
ncbi:MAG: type III restriction protein res subunit, partial [uncultured bacterium]